MTPLLYFYSSTIEQTKSLAVAGNSATARDYLFVINTQLSALNPPQVTVLKIVRN